MKTNLFRRIAAAMIAIAGFTVHASTFTVGGSGNSFTITRAGEGTNATETVYYRTVGLSAYAGQHFTAKSGQLTFVPGQTATNITVSTRSPSNAAYSFQTGATRSYRFELLDVGGFNLASPVRAITTGTSVSATDAFAIKNVTIQSAEYTADDDGYDKNGYMSVSSNGYFNAAAPQAYFLQVGAQLRMTLGFQAKENDDGYQYLQLLVDNSATCDNRNGYSDGDPGTPSLSRYMAGFEIKSGSKDASYKSYTFPVTNVTSGAGAANPWGHGADYPLDMQKFKSGCRATDGRLILPLGFSSIVLRLNTSGKSGSDEWAVKNVIAHIQAVDATAPTLLGASVSPGPYHRGNPVSVSLAFSENVSGNVKAGSAYIDTSWGMFIFDRDNSGGNILSFSGTISGSTVNGSPLTLNSLNGFSSIKDLAGNVFDGSVSRTIAGATVAETDHDYTISYDLADGALPDDASNPTTYNYDTPSFTLANPIRPGYTFTGWSGTDVTGTKTSVSVAHAHGDRAYTAHWTPIAYAITYANATNGIDGIVNANPTVYTIEDETVTLSAPSRACYTFGGWFDNPGFTGGAVASFSTAGLGDRIFYAEWVPITYAVHFAANGGSGTMADQTFTYDTPQALTTNTFTRLYHTFTGWSGVNATFTDGEIVRNLADTQGATVTLTATWNFVPPWEGSGTATDPYRISTRQQLDDLAVCVNAGIGDCYRASYRLEADIAYDPAVTNSFTPIGKNTSFCFSGTFDGNGHTISGIRISRRDDQFQGLFGALSGTVKDLTLADSAMEGADFIGAIAGLCYAGSIENCLVIGTTLSRLGTGINIGAIAGRCEKTTLSGNAYHNSAVVRNGATDTVSIGTGNQQDNLNTVSPCYTLSLAEGIVTDTAPQFVFPVFGTNYSYYVGMQPVTLRAETEHTIRNVSINGDSATVTDNGDGTFSFLMPNADATVTADVEALLAAIPYIDADGVERLCTDYTVLTNATGQVTYGTSGEESWYVVTGNVTINGELHFRGTAHLILCDGATLTVATENTSVSLSVGNDLTFYGQVNGTGCFTVRGDGGPLSSPIYATGDITINGGNVTVTSDGGPYSIYATGDITINGGTVTVDGTIYVDETYGNIILGWRTLSDSITANRYLGHISSNSRRSFTVKIKDGQMFTDGTTTYEGELNDFQISAIAGKTLRPYVDGIPYIGADGEWLSCADYTVLTNVNRDITYGTSGVEAWYVVTNDVTISGFLSLNGDAHLILCDGATLTVATENTSVSLSVGNDLTIYGQANGTGRLTATVQGLLGGNGIRANGNITVNGGNVAATGYGFGTAINAKSGNVTINGGNVAANGVIYARMITLGWLNPTDSISASGYDGTVKAGQTFIDGDGNLYSDTLDPSAIAGKTLRPHIPNQTYPAYLDGADEQVKATYTLWAARYGADVNSAYETAFLLNVAPEATPAVIHIAGIEVGDGTATVRVVATSGGVAVDLAAINGILVVATGDEPVSLTPKAIPEANITYDNGAAVIVVPEADGRFIQARIVAAAPAESLPPAP